MVYVAAACFMFCVIMVWAVLLGFGPLREAASISNLRKEYLLGERGGRIKVYFNVIFGDN